VLSALRFIGGGGGGFLDLEGGGGGGAFFPVAQSGGFAPIDQLGDRVCS
jgi:hypothetical protein